MIVDSKEYLGLLWRIQDENPPSIAVLAPASEPFIEVDWSTRTINAPEFISVKSDHRSEVVYFKMPRFYDGYDLTNTIGIIQYINAKGEGRVYPIPFYDVDTCSDEDMILFPWEIEGEATKAAGTVQYSLRFYKLDTTKEHLQYNLNSLPAASKVLEGIQMKYDEVYNIIELTEETYKKGVYYTLSKNKTYQLCYDDFNANEVYYEKTTLNMNATDYTATFLEQVVEYAREAASHDLTWLVI